MFPQHITHPNRDMDQPGTLSDSYGTDSLEYGFIGQHGTFDYAFLHFPESEIQEAIAALLATLPKPSDKETIDRLLDPDLFWLGTPSSREPGQRTWGDSSIPAAGASDASEPGPVTGAVEDSACAERDDAAADVRRRLLHHVAGSKYGVPNPNARLVDGAWAANESPAA
ncbi:hypothetical protein C8Q76DRAFT_698186 [Earliella scabrosa]|nr:hypothetical protein C8Q76DRAFT_698186 [Earliella scabrosa]